MEKEREWGMISCCIGLHDDIMKVEMGHPHDLADVGIVVDDVISIKRGYM